MSSLPIAKLALPSGRQRPLGGRIRRDDGGHPRRRLLLAAVRGFRRYWRGGGVLGGASACCWLRTLLGGRRGCPRLVAGKVGGGGRGWSCRWARPVAVGTVVAAAAARVDLDFGRCDVHFDLAVGDQVHGSAVPGKGDVYAGGVLLPLS